MTVLPRSDARDRVAASSRGGGGIPPRVGISALVATLLLWFPGAGHGQGLDLSGYYLHAAAAVERSAFTDGGVMDVQRVRLMARPRWGAVDFQIAYEHSLTLRSGEIALGRGFEGMEAAAPWLDLQGTLVERRRVTWAHGLDRLSLSFRMGERVRTTLGRQSISWATTLYFTPADPFVPFDPADPFREYRGGVDAARAVLHLGPFSELEAVVRPGPAASPTALGANDGEAEGREALTALVRGQTLVRRLEVSAWAGIVHEDAAVAVGATGTVGELGLRTEAGVRRHEGGTILRLVVGADRLFELRGRDLRAVLEYQHDGFGARRPEELLPTAVSAPAGRGELSVLGRDAVVLSASYQMHPLTSVQLLSLVNARDGSALVSPAVVGSLTDEISLRVGGFAGLGARADGPTLRSEHGATPLVGYAALSLFF